MSTCIKCGVELVPGAVYCHICGKKQVKETRKSLKRPNGAGTVYKLSGRRTRPWAAAKNHVIIGYYERKTDALAALEKLSGKPIEEKFNMTFSEVFAEWKAEHFREIGPKGIEAYDISYKACASLHGKKFRDLRTKDFQAIIDSNMAKSNSTLSKYKQLMTQMSRWAVREEIATTDFAKYVKLPQQVKKEKAIFTDDEIALLEKTAPMLPKSPSCCFTPVCASANCFPCRWWTTTRRMSSEEKRQKPVETASSQYVRRAGSIFPTLPTGPTAICYCPATTGSASPPITANVTFTLCWKSSASQSTRPTPRATPTQHGQEA